MTRRRIFLLAGIGTLLVLALAAGVWFLLRRRAPVPEVPGSVVVPPPVTAPVTNTNAPTTPPRATGPASAEEVARRQISATAMQFTERYGSYSTDGDYENVSDLFPLMTAALQSESETMIRTGRSAPPADSYVGVTTKAVSAHIQDLNLSAGTAAVTVQTQRVTQTPTSRGTSYETLSLSFVRSGTVWKVNRVSWQESEN